MLTPISLYQTDRTIADDFVSKVVNEFDWILFVFYGDLKDTSFLPPSNLASLGETIVNDGLEAPGALVQSKGWQTGMAPLYHIHMLPW